MDARAEAKSRVIVSAVIVRACSVCGGPRQQGADCGGCGNTEPAVTQDAGIVAAQYTNPVEALAWKLFGQWRAARRIARINRENANGNDG
jgi:hypothetical protein